MTDIRKLMAYLEEEEVEAVFWFGPKQSITGVPKYQGFNIDIGEMYQVNGKSMAQHDFRSLVIINPDNHYVQEHQP